MSDAPIMFDDENEDAAGEYYRKQVEIPVPADLEDETAPSADVDAELESLARQMGGWTPEDAPDAPAMEPMRLIQADEAHGQELAGLPPIFGSAGLAGGESPEPVDPYAGRAATEQDAGLIDPESRQDRDSE